MSGRPVRPGAPDRDGGRGVTSLEYVRRGMTNDPGPDAGGAGPDGDDPRWWKEAVVY